MDAERDALSLLNHVADGTVSPEDVLLQFKPSPFEDLGYAKVDHHRDLRQGVPEVIYGQSGTPEQVAGILGALRSCDCENILVTRITRETAGLIAKNMETTYELLARLAITFPEEAEEHGSIVVATDGIDDMGVMGEAALTIEALRNPVTWAYDVGVTGLYRLLGNLRLLMTARVMTTVAGMEGALADTIGGLVDCPVVTVPTGVGYGASFGGVTTLLSTPNSRASDVSVANIDNELGTGYLASQTSHVGESAHGGMP